MANGFSLAALAGRKELLELGNIIEEGRERTFLLSSTHGSEMCSLGAFVETMNIYNNENVTDKLWEKGLYFKDKFNQLSRGLGMGIRYILKVQGSVKLSDKEYGRQRLLKAKDVFRTRVNIKPNIDAMDINIPGTYSNIIDKTLEEIGNSMEKYKRALDEGVDNKLKGDIIKPVFRKYN